MSLLLKYWLLAHGWSVQLEYCGCHIPGITRGDAQITRRPRIGERGEENELAGFLETVMGQLMSKEVLYDPLKELAEGVSPPSLPSSTLIYQYPVFTYLTHPPNPLSPEDRSRHENQEECAKRFLAVFDKPGYSDANEESNKAIVDHMSEVRYLSF